MKWSGKINSWAWVKHLKYIEKSRFERNFKQEKTLHEELMEGFEEEKRMYEDDK
jgi:hypothetical protein